MKFSLLSLLLCLLCSQLLFAQASSQPKAKKVVFIIVDGIPADVLERVATHSLDSIASVGRYMRAFVGGQKDGYTQTPTISAVGYNSLLTGTWVNKHNVTGNDIKAPNYHYPTIFRLLKQQYPLKTTAVFSSWTDNRTKLVGDTMAATGHLAVDFAFDGYELDTIRFPHDKPGLYMHHIDELVASSAASVIGSKAPDLSWVYLEYTDDVAHRFGDSKQFDSAVQLMDAQIGRIWQAIQHRQQNNNEEWLLVVTTDHGRDEKTGKSHGGQSDRQRNTWIVTNDKNTNTYAKYYTPAIVDLMPTMARFLQIKIPEPQLYEVDGTPLIGGVMIARAGAYLTAKYIDVSWKALLPEAKVTIKMATANNAATGGADVYTTIAEVPAAREHYLIDISNNTSDFYKIVLVSPLNTLNVWVQKK